MTITVEQMRAAGRELRMRREGKVKKAKSRQATDRPFGAATEKTLERFASGPTDREIAEMERELALRDTGLIKRRANRGRDTHRPFEEAQTTTLRRHVKRKRKKG